MPRNCWPTGDLVCGIWAPGIDGDGRPAGISDFACKRSNIVHPERGHRAGGWLMATAIRSWAAVRFSRASATEQRVPGVHSTLHHGDTEKSLANMHASGCKTKQHQHLVHHAPRNTFPVSRTPLVITPRCTQKKTRKENTKIKHLKSRVRVPSRRK